jgi:hypothetical protein
MTYRLVSKFEETFRSGPYIHRNSQIGNRIADYLFDDLYDLDNTSRLHRDIDAGLRALNPKGLSPGLNARRGDGSFGPLVPGHRPRIYPGHSVAIGQTAEVDIGIEVKILAKSMIKQIDRVVSDLCGQARHFGTKSPNAITVGLVGINLAESYTSYEGTREYPTGEYGPHPVSEAPEAERRLLASAAPCYTEFLIFTFKASNVAPWDFSWVRLNRINDEYGAALRRVLRSYERSPV